VSREIIIAIDGYSSCGKSTLARDLAAALHYRHVDSGAMYRAVTLFLIRHRIAPDHPAEIQAALPGIQITFIRGNDGNLTLLNGENVESQIRSAEVSRLVSPVAAISEVRKLLVAQQRQMRLDGKGLVMDGRDIGTVVFPEAELKIFLTAQKEVRVERRYLELLANGIRVSKNEVEEGMSKRDLIDTTREDSPLRQAKDAVVIDNTFLTREQQLAVAHQFALDVIAGLA
jgi:cytidylate kinase